MPEGGPLGTAQILSRLLTQVQEIDRKLDIHLAEHRLTARVHRALYGTALTIIGTLAGILASRR